MSRTDGAVHRRRFTLRPPPPFELAVVARSHGWFNLPPFSWDEERGELALSFRAGELPVTVSVSQSEDVLRGRIAAFRPISAAVAREVKATAASCLRLDEDLTGFYELARGHRRLDWVCSRGAGRVLRAPTAFEDLVKMICTTNCSWALTRTMVTRLVESLGEPAPGGRTFPTPRAMAQRPLSFFRERVRAGYRAGYLRGLARRVARAQLDPERWRRQKLPTQALRKELLALEGVGPYAAAHMLRMLGHYDDPGIDSWCRSKYRRIYRLSRAPSDAGMLRRYRGFGRWLGLALWMDLTREWHVGDEAWP